MNKKTNYRVFVQTDTSTNAYMGKKKYDREKDGYGGCLVWFIPIIAMLLLSCNRKLHTEKTETKSSDTHVVNTDSIIQVNKTLSEAYEELLKTTNSTGVVFESIPCDSGRIGGAGMPHLVNKITVAPDGTKTFEGAIKSYKDDVTKFQQRIFAQQETIDSLNQLVKKDTTHHEQSAVVVVRNVKTSFTPLWVWLALGAAIFLWLNERFRFINIPFLTRKI